LGSIAAVAPLVAVFPLMAVVMSYLVLRENGCMLRTCSAFLVSVAGVIFLLIGAT
jgi:uncharacterized membrane protein